MADDFKGKYIEEKEQWEKTKLAKSFARVPERDATFRTLSEIEIKPLYGPGDIDEPDKLHDKLGFPGSYPFTRGPQASMYRGKPWTMRQFAGFGSAEDTNARFKYLLEQGQTGLSTAFDLPTLMGYDSDHEFSKGEVGREGVAIDTLEDMERLFDGIPLDKVTTSMTINAPAPILIAMLAAVAEKQGVALAKVGGTSQNDMFKEFIAQKEWVVPPAPSTKLVVDTMEWCAEHMPRWNTISISGYHIREAGATAVQELAFTLADGIGYVEAAIERGLDVDSFAPRLSFFFDVHNDFFEEIAKFRAARRIWADVMKNRFQAKNPRSWLLRTHAQTAGVSLTAQQPYNNIVRVAIQAVAGVLGGTQSLHTNSMDETYALPTEQAVTIALRTQQVILEETGIASTIDPLAGSYFVERLTDQVEEGAREYIKRIDDMGGVLKAIENAYPQREIAEAAFLFQQQIERNERKIVGINAYARDEACPIETLKIDPSIEINQKKRLSDRKEGRDAAAVKSALSAIEEAAKSEQNTMPAILEAVKAYATVGEICDVFRAVWGEYQEPAIF